MATMRQKFFDVEMVEKGRSGSSKDGAEDRVREVVAERRTHRGVPGAESPRVVPGGDRYDGTPADRPG